MGNPQKVARPSNEPRDKERDDSTNIVAYSLCWRMGGVEIWKLEGE